MDYDPIKDRLGKLFGGVPILHKAFFALLHLIFLRAWFVRQALRTYLPKDARLLDAGTGFAQYAYYVARRYPGVRVTATDIKEDYLANARAFFDAVGLSGRVDFVRDDLTHPAVSGSFDCILAVDVLEHIKDDEEVLAHLCRLVRPGGHIIISTPSDLGGSDVHAGGQESFIGEHVRDGYNVADLERKICSAGLNVAQRRYTYGRYGTVAWRILVKIPVIALGWWWVSIVFLPVYYLLVLPIGLLLNWVDLSSENETGTGLLMVVQKPVIAASLHHS